MDSNKRTKGVDFDRNRRIQKQVEKLFEVDPETFLICLGDLNGRLKTLEPSIETDCNGRMIENWISNFNLYHLNRTVECIGKYTFNTVNGKSAIDHILTNDKMYMGYKGMHIYEDRSLVDIKTDHCLVRAWFKIGPTSKTTWKKRKWKKVTIIKKDEESLSTFRETFKKQIGKKTSFNKYMEKMKTVLKFTLKKEKRICTGRK